MTDCKRLISNGSSAGIGLTGAAVFVTLTCFWGVPPCALRLRFADLDCAIVTGIFVQRTDALIRTGDPAFLNAERIFTEHRAELAAGGRTKIRRDVSGCSALPLQVYDLQKEANYSSELLIMRASEIH